MTYHVAVSAHLLFKRSVDYFHWENIEAIFNSAYFALLGLLSTGSILNEVKVQEINFYVYRA